MAQVKLVKIAQGGWVRCDVTFPSPEVALATALRWRAEDEAAGHPYSQTWIEEDEEHMVVRGDRIGPLSPGELALLDHLYPTCHHGMDATLCMDPDGPNHWGTAEQERMGML